MSVTDLFIVTNNSLSMIVSKKGGTPFILPDKLPVVESSRKHVTAKNRHFTIVYICTFADDEPFDVFFKAIDMLNRECCVYVTGNYKKKFSDQVDRYSNKIKFTGYLDEVSYWKLLNNADLIVDLTYREDCLVCGAYEAVALGKPLLLSNTKALKAYFSKGCVFANNNVEDIRNSLIFCIENHDILAEHIVLLKKELSESWLDNSERFLQKIMTITRDR